MRYPEGQKEATRQKIVDAAGRVFRRRGYTAASVDAVMAEAGLTAGAFYKHFESKERLLTETLQVALENQRDQRETGLSELTGPAWVLGLAENYLSIEHWRAIETGCPLPPLLADISRSEEPVRRSIQAGLDHLSATLAQHLDDESTEIRKTRALGVLATMVGGMAIARSFEEEEACLVLEGARRTVRMALEHRNSAR